MFGPYAGWSPKFLKHGHVTDLPRSVKPDNLLSMLGVGVTQLTLLNYLIGQLRLSKPDRVRMLREFAPSAVDSDWEPTVAGQRVQVIRRDRRKGGVLEFSTTVVNSADGSIAGLLGGSPGASTAVPIMLDVLQRCFNHRYQSWLPTLKEMVPSLGAELSRNPRCMTRCWSWGQAGLVRNWEGPVSEALRRIWAKDLDAQALYELLKLRVEVFVVEQAIPYPELDGRDLLAETRHFWLERPDGEVICTLRLMEEHAGGEKVFRIGRLCTKRSARGQGHTSRLLRAALAEVGDYPCRINAQTYLADMYSQFGFVRDGDDFLDDGVPHVPMLRPGSGLAEKCREAVSVQRDRRTRPTAARAAAVRGASGDRRGAHPRREGHRQVDGRARAGRAAGAPAWSKCRWAPPRTG